MQRIEKAGEYVVTIREPRWVEMPPKDNDTARMQLVLPGYCEIDGEEHVIDGRLLFLRTIVGSGTNKGKALWEVSARTCTDLGMSEPFNPSNIAELDNCEAVYVVQPEEYEGKVRMRVRFINPVRRRPLSDEAAASIWAKLTGDAASANDDDDDLDMGDNNDSPPF